MILNGTEYYQGRGDAVKFANPKLTAGDTIQVLYDDTDPPLPGTKRMTAGYYTVKNVRDSFSTNFGMIYELVKIRSKNVFYMSTIAIDKAILGGVINA